MHTDLPTLSIEPLRMRFDFGYSQLHVEDSGQPHHDISNWTKTHTEQGFTRGESVVFFGTPIQNGTAHIRVTVGSFVLRPIHSRAVAVPFRVISGEVSISDCEQPQDSNRRVRLPSGVYRLCCAQRAIDDANIDVELVFEPVRAPVPRSEVLKADSDMNPPSVLLEVGHWED